MWILDIVRGFLRALFIWSFYLIMELIMFIELCKIAKGLFGFSVSITHNSVFITHNSKMVGSMAEKFVWIFITLFPVFVSIIQFSDFWVMSYGNWKHILGVFSFHNSVSNDILVIKHTWRDPLLKVSRNFWPFFFLLHFSFFSTVLQLFFLLFFSFFFCSFHSWQLIIPFLFCSSSHNIFGLRSVLSFFFFFSSFIGLHWLRFLFFFFTGFGLFWYWGLKEKKKKTAPSYRYGAHK